MFGGIPGQGIGEAAIGTASAEADRSARIKQGGNVTAASIITQTRPVYPPLARQARIQGNVVLHAIIDKEGKVAQLEVDLRSPAAGASGSGRRETMAL